MPDRAAEADDTLRAIARAALLEITGEATIGADAGQIDEGDGVVSVQFASAMPGYPDWRWTVSIATLEGLEPSVLEVELLPAEGALLAPDWVPWSERLADWKAAQAEAAAAADGETDDVDGELDDDADDSEDDDESDEDEDDDEDEFPRPTHGGDLDGVDIDEADDSDDDEGDDSDR